MVPSKASSRVVPQRRRELFLLALKCREAGDDRLPWAWRDVQVAPLPTEALLPRTLQPHEAVSVQGPEGLVLLLVLRRLFQAPVGRGSVPWRRTIRLFTAVLFCFF